MAFIVSTLRTELTVAHTVSLDSTWATDGPYNNPFARLYWVTAGRAVIHHHSRDYHLTPGGLYLVPAHTPIWFHCPRRMNKDYLHFVSDVLGQADWLDRLGCPFEVHPDDPKHISALFTRIIRVFHSNAPGRMIESDGLLRQLLTPFFAAIPPEPTDSAQQRERFEPVLAYIESHLTDKITLKELAELLHLQPTYFSNLFCTVMGVAPLQYLRRRRIERSQAMLWYESTPIKDVAQRLGFSDVFHFSHAFRRVTGLSPAAFRNQKHLPLP